MKTKKLTIEHENGNKIEVMINNMEYNMIMKILLFDLLNYDIHKKIPYTKRLAQKDIHNDSLSSNDGSEE